MARALLDFGQRVQESVFVAHLDEELAERMKERVERLVDADWDRLHVFEMCAGCAKRVWMVGSAEVAREAEWYVI